MSRMNENRETRSPWPFGLRAIFAFVGVCAVLVALGRAFQNDLSTVGLALLLVLAFFLAIPRQ
jgi:hypothetical protein